MVSHLHIGINISVFKMTVDSEVERHELVARNGVVR